MQQVLVIGGAGFIGSRAAHYLAQQGYNVLILDAYIHNQVFDPEWATVIRGDYGNRAVLDDIFSSNSISAVMHFASLIQVGESVKDPLKYYDHNVTNMITLLQAMHAHGVQDLIFSSSAAVYGTPTVSPIPESHNCDPINPYGNTKYIIERLLADCAQAYGLRYCALRYFNAAGGSPDLFLGEQHEPETHVIPLLLDALATGSTFKIFGDNYDTPDGTCIRDYLHVADLASAHHKALEHLWSTKNSAIMNLGTGTGTSIRELIKSAEVVTGQQALVEVCQRRMGDPDRLVADPTRAQSLLGWQPEHSSPEIILCDAWGFYQLRNQMRVASGLVGRRNTTTVAD